MNIILRGKTQVAYAHECVDRAGVDWIVSIKEPTRSTAQNAKLWAMLGDVARCKMLGRDHTPDVWKAVMMNACGHTVAFEHGLNGEWFPIGFRSSKLSVRQMADLITFIQQTGDANGVVWRDTRRGGWME